MIFILSGKYKSLVSTVKQTQGPAFIPRVYIREVRDAAT